eukprot:TRINITY_DN3283_c0_g2_i1.p1 TRINITY_DN3283_c0_g2~~TRINITY_DN3283_c0_g2_i1.p1  ORF type:complete len:457 (-),score=92.95 TRINITY_DN3283_c0_g2_i1:1237-2607(-)
MELQSHTPHAPNVMRMTKEEAPTITQPSGSEIAETEASSQPNPTSQSVYKNRLALFESVIEGPKINFDRARELSFGGIPDSLRSLYWKLLLSYLPNDRTIWPSFLQKNRDLYQTFLTELTIDPRVNHQNDDHPLSTSNQSQWNKFFQDKDTLDEIDKDVKRTLPHLHFFNHDKEVGDTTHYEALKRILFVYAKLNPGIKYVQGMNEILGPVYYIFAKDTDPMFAGNAEADTFFCFTNIMSEVRDNFCKSLDKSILGVQGQLDKLTNLLKLKDVELWSDFQEKAVNTQFYGFRWITLLLSQEFELPDVLRLWDSLFSDPFRFEHLTYVCCAMLECIRERLLDGSFADNLKSLQNYPIQDVHVILSKAEEIKSPEYSAPPPRPSKPKPKETQSSWVSSTRNVISPSVPKANMSMPIPGEEETMPEATLLPLRMPKPPKPFGYEDSDDEDSESKSHPLE